MTRVLTKYLFLCAFVCTACDESQAFHDPHPSLERMQTQARVDPFDPDAMKTPLVGTVAEESDEEEDALDGGATPFRTDARLLEEGRAGFNRFCAPCHGMTGNGESVVASKMHDTPPGSLVDGANAALPPDAIYRVIRDGKRTMPSLAHELTRRERWAAVAYLQALGLSRHAKVNDLSAQDLDALERGGAR